MTAPIPGPSSSTTVMKNQEVFWDSTMNLMLSIMAPKFNYNWKEVSGVLPKMFVPAGLILTPKQCELQFHKVLSTLGDVGSTPSAESSVETPVELAQSRLMKQFNQTVVEKRPIKAEEEVEYLYTMKEIQRLEDESIAFEEEDLNTVIMETMLTDEEDMDDSDPDYQRMKKLRKKVRLEIANGVGPNYDDDSEFESDSIDNDEESDKDDDQSHEKLEHESKTEDLIGLECTTVSLHLKEDPDKVDAYENIPLLDPCEIKTEVIPIMELKNENYPESVALKMEDNQSERLENKLAVFEIPDKICDTNGDRGEAMIQDLAKVDVPDIVPGIIAQAERIGCKSNDEENASTNDIKIDISIEMPSNVQVKEMTDTILPIPNLVVVPPRIAKKKVHPPMTILTKEDLGRLQKIRREDAFKRDIGLMTDVKIKMSPEKSQQVEDQRKFKKVCLLIHERVQRHKYGNKFELPTKKSPWAAQYYSIVKEPKSLKTIKSDINQGVIKSFEQYEKDLALMFLNVTTFNGTDSVLAKYASEMAKDTFKILDEYKYTQKLLQAKKEAEEEIVEGSGSIVETSMTHSTTMELKTNGRGGRKRKSSETTKSQCN